MEGEIEKGRRTVYAIQRQPDIAAGVNGLTEVSPMSDHTLLPHGEDLRRAVRWLSEHHQHDIRAIEEASIRFDLSPLDEEFLIQHCVEREGSAN